MILEFIKNNHDPLNIGIYALEIFVILLIFYIIDRKTNLFNIIIVAVIRLLDKLDRKRGKQ